MKRLFHLFGFILFLYGSTSLSEAVVDRVVAVVNQEIITLSEVEKRIPSLKEEIVTEDRLERQERMQALWRQVLEKLIEEKLIDQEAKKSRWEFSMNEYIISLQTGIIKNIMSFNLFKKKNEEPFPLPGRVSTDK